MKRLFLCVITLFLSLLSACQQEEVKDTTMPVSLIGVVTSDLHYMRDGENASSIVPLVEEGDAFMQCLVNQVIDIHPDVFIATGDLTNDGKASDLQYLSTYLKQMKDVGISIIVTTGNHDYGQGDISSFEEYLYPLVNIDSKDTDSLSYTSIVNDVCFIAMDDGYSDLGDTGTLSQKTMQWLEQQLQKANTSEQKIVFLSHRSVLFEDQSSQNHYTITNSDLKTLLEKYHVRVCFTGHQHTQSLLQNHDMYELISSMPMSGMNNIGIMKIEDNTFSYQTSLIDFEQYASEELLTFIEENIETGYDRLYETYSPLFDAQGISKEDQEGIFSLFQRFVVYAQTGTISSHEEEIRNDEYYTAMLDALRDYNYGPWMERLMEDIPLDASQFTFVWD